MSWPFCGPDFMIFTSCFSLLSKSCIPLNNFVHSIFLVKFFFLQRCGTCHFRTNKSEAKCTVMWSFWSPAKLALQFIELRREKIISQSYNLECALSYILTDELICLRLSLTLAKMFWWLVWRLLAMDSSFISDSTDLSCCTKKSDLFHQSCGWNLQVRPSKWKLLILSN